MRGGAIGYQPHGVPKRVLVYPLQSDAAAQLAAARAPEHWRPHQAVITLQPDQRRSLRAYLDQVSDPRSRRGLRYRLAPAAAERALPSAGKQQLALHPQPGGQRASGRPDGGLGGRASA